MLRRSRMRRERTMTGNSNAQKNGSLGAVPQGQPPARSRGKTDEPSWRTGAARWIVTGFLALLAAAVVYFADGRGFLEVPELHGYDMLVTKQKAEAPPSDILYVDFDEDTVSAYNAFPLPRALVGQVIQRISSGKPKVIALDVILDLKRENEHGGADDQHLATTIADAGNVILVSEYGFDGQSLREPLPEFADGADGLAFGDVPIDADGSVRRMFLAALTKSYQRFSFPVQIAKNFSERHLSEGKNGHILFGQEDIPLATANPPTAWIHFHPSPPVRAISVQRVLSKEFDPAIFQGKIVMIGQTSEVGKDLFDTPVTRADVQIYEQGSSKPRSELSGTEVHAAAVATLLQGDFLERLSPLAHWSAGIGLAFLVIALGFHSRWYVALGMYLVLALVIFLVSLWMFSKHHIWVPFISLEACIVLALPAGLGYRSVEERREKNLMEAERRQIMGLFERYVSADVAAEIWKRRDEIVLGGEERAATILFSDIRGFTAMTAGVPSSEVLAWLNRYLTAMAEVVKANRGFLNKFIGDGIMVVFGAPLTDGAQEDACRAAQCAIDMLARMDDWNAALLPGQPQMKIGIGIHSGTVTAGNVGSLDRMEYSVIGEAVNLASRLEALTKDFGTPIVISPATWEHIRHCFTTVSLGEAQVRGFTSAIPLYSVQKSSNVEVHQ
jgi:adenylate cyclase